MSKQPKPSPEDSLYGSIEDELRESQESQTEEATEGWDDNDDDRPPSSLSTALFIIIPLATAAALIGWLIKVATSE